MAAVFTLYMVLAVEYYEEPKLIAEFGKSYIEYKKNVPKYIPFYKIIFRVWFILETVCISNKFLMQFLIFVYIIHNGFTV